MTMIKCNPDLLTDALRLANKATARGGYLPILHSFLVEADEAGKLIISGSDIDVAVSVAIEAEIEGAGRTTVPAQTLFDLVRQLKSAESITLDMDGPGKIGLDAGSTSASLKTMPANEYPSIPLPNDEEIMLPMDVLAEGIDLVHWSTDKKQGRPILTGINFGIDDGVLALTAADGYRAARFKTAVTPKSLKLKSVILPAKALRLLRPTLEEEEGMVRIHQIDDESSRMVFTTPGVKVTSNVIEGAYPDIDSVIPEEWETRAVVSAPDLLELVTAATVISEQILFSLSANGRLEIKSSGIDGDYGAELLVENMEGSPNNFSLNGEYVSQLLKAAGEASIRVQCTTMTSPVRFDLIGMDYSHVIMPLFTRE